MNSVEATTILTPTDNGYDGPPFCWDQARRFLLRCELDATFFHLYLGTPTEWSKTGSKDLLETFPTPRDALAYIMDSFPIVKRKDIAKHNHYRTKSQILEIYDRMQRAIDTNTSYKTVLDPPPADPRLAHPLPSSSGGSSGPTLEHNME